MDLYGEGRVGLAEGLVQALGMLVGDHFVGYAMGEKQWRLEACGQAKGIIYGIPSLAVGAIPPA
jgi:hypothetical protein